MAYLSRAELQTHLYSGVIKEINREDNLNEYPTVADFPVSGQTGFIYLALDTVVYYKWASTAYVVYAYIDNAIEAIKAATAEARGYLTAYDMDAIFAAVDDDRNPIVLLYIKDIAVWHYIQLANPAVDMELRLKRYEQAIKFLEKVQSGKTNPNLPYPPATPPGDTNTYIKYGGNDKRLNNF